MDHIWLSHSSVSGHVSCFHFLAIMNSVAMNIQVFSQVFVFNSFGHIPNSETARKIRIFFKHHQCHLMHAVVRG